MLFEDPPELIALFNLIRADWMQKYAEGFAAGVEHFRNPDPYRTRECTAADLGLTD